MYTKDALRKSVFWVFVKSGGPDQQRKSHNIDKSPFVYIDLSYGDAVIQWHNVIT